MIRQDGAPEMTRMRLRSIALAGIVAVHVHHLSGWALRVPANLDSPWVAPGKPPACDLSLRAGGELTTPFHTPEVSHA